MDGVIEQGFVSFDIRSAIMSGQKPRKIGRDAKTGEFIPVKEAERRPKTTVVETIKPSNGDKKK
jgi:hypothetical protein